MGTAGGEIGAGILACRGSRRRPDTGHRRPGRPWHNVQSMAFLSNFRADRLIALIKSSNDILGTEAQKAVAKLKELGPSGIPAVLAALPDADKHATVAFVDVLAAIANVKSFP